MKMQDLASMKYAELRKLAKSAGIKANQKQEKLIAELTKYYEKQKTEKKDVKAAKTPISTPKIAPKTPTLSQNPRTPLVSSKTNTPKSTPVASSKVATPKTVSKGTPNSGKPASRWEKKVFSPVKAARPSNGKMPASPLVKQVAVKRKQVDTPENSQPTKKCRSTFEKAPTPDLMSPKVVESKKRRSTFEKPPTLKTPEIAPNSSEKRRSGRLSSSSPAVKEMLGAMRSDMNDDEMKNSLMSILDKNVQEKGSTNIPRFAEFVKNRQAAKPITPGNKNWEKIHKKNFEKFDSIDVYLQKKRKRVEDMSASVKKAKTLLSEVHSAVNKLKSHKTPETNENKFVKPRKSGGNKTTPFKPTVMNTSKMNLNFGAKQRKSNASKTSPFKPTVLNTSKMNLNFGAKPTPKTLPRKSPKSLIPSATKKQPIDARKSTSSVPNRKSTATPFKFTAVHNSTLNSSVASTKKNTFDIKASLARPITWKAHKGKLKPLSTDTKSPVYLKTNSAAKANKMTKDRAASRNTVTNRRANRKNHAQMARRGINV